MKDTCSISELPHLPKAQLAKINQQWAISTHVSKPSQEWEIHFYQPLQMHKQ